MAEACSVFSGSAIETAGVREMALKFSPQVFLSPFPNQISFPLKVPKGFVFNFGAFSGVG